MAADIATDFKVKVGGQELSPSDADLIAFSVEKDLGQPDMCVVTIRNAATSDDANAYTNSLAPGGPVEITLGEGGEAAFKGEIVGLEPVYRSGGDNIVIVRAFHKMHKMLRGRKSMTFLNQSDKDIFSKIVGQYSLSPQAGDAPVITHEHVYQHCQTDLEFLRFRARRVGCEIWADGDKIYFAPPNKGKDSGVTVEYKDVEAGGTGFFLTYFAPRMSTANVVSKVIVRGWNPETKEEIVGESEPISTSLGQKDAVAGSGSHGSTTTYEVDQPVFSVDEAKKLANARLAELAMSYMTGEGECQGWNTNVKPGTVVTVKVNVDGNDRFNGKYLVTGVTYKYRGNTNNNKGGHVTAIRVRRDAEGG